MQLLVNIDVDDLDRSIAFYSAAFDVQVGRRFGAHGVELLGSSAPIYFLVKAAGTRAAPDSSEQPVRTSSWGKLALMADPFGHGFCFVEFLGSGYDQIAPPADHRERWATEPSTPDFFTTRVEDVCALCSLECLRSA